MKKGLIVFAVVIAVAVFAKQQISTPSNSRHASDAKSSGSPNLLQSIVSKLPGSKGTDDAVKDRFEMFMKSWKEGGVSLNDAEQSAACRWARGKPFIPDNDDLRAAVDSFDQWRKAKGLYVQDISYEIGEYHNDGDDLIVDVKINGSKHRIGIPKTPNPMFWAN